ncbi:MAG: hypothetical protein ACYTJ0_17445, partial [Planctomycetota bacterium]
MDTRALIVLLVGVVTTPAWAQFSRDPAVNFAVADGPSDQVQLKLAATPTGGTYVSWFDGLANGFDVRLQRLDADGNEAWTHNGVLVANRSFSSTQDYDLAVDGAGNALLVFRDDRGGPVQITATLVAPDGTQPWGPLGVTVTSGSAFYAAPKIAATSDGFIVAAWTQDADAALQKLDGDGVEQRESPTVVSDAGGMNLVPSDLVPGDAGSVVMSMVRYGSFSDPRQLHAQKVAADGTPAWEQPTVVFDGGSLQFGNFPTIVADGAGGAVFGWYSSSPSLQVFAQRVLADGTEVFAHNGVAGSTNATRLRVSPAVAFDAASGETYLFWTETNAGQSQDGVYGQKLADEGDRQWTDDGRAIVPVGAHDIAFVNVLPTGDGAVVGWIDSLGFGNDRVHASRVDGDGNAVWMPGIADVSTVSSDKSRLASTTIAGGTVVFAWQDDRNDAGDGFVQNVRPDGGLGPGECPDTNGDGVVDVDDLVSVILDWGTDGSGNGGDVDGSGTVDVD